MTNPDFVPQARAAVLAAVCEDLAADAFQVERDGMWPSRGVDRLAASDLLSWFIPSESGEQGVEETLLLETLVALSSACLNTTFVLTQILGAARRIAASTRKDVRDQFLPAILDGSSLATLGISHLTTSGQHLTKPMLEAKPCSDGFRLQGRIPWVTGAAHCPWIVAGAVDEKRRPMMFLLSTSAAGVEIDESSALVALNASQTASVRCRDVAIPESQILFGAKEEGVFGAQLGRSGGLQTSALALGVAERSLRFLIEESQKRSGLAATVEALLGRTESVRAMMKRAVQQGRSEDRAPLRVAANSVALDTTHAALVVAKGAGYVRTHPVAQWCQQALFFLVWSCPAAVLEGQLLDFAGVVPVGERET